MVTWVYELATGVFLRGGPCEQTYDAGTQGLTDLHRNPKPRTERYDGAGGIRPATAQEISDYDAAQQAARSVTRFDDEKLIKALAIWTAGKLNVPLATARQEILTIYRGL